MTAIDKLLKEIQSINSRHYMKKSDKILIKEHLEKIKPKLTKNECTEIESLIEILSTTVLTTQQKKKLSNSKTILINIVKKYAEEFNEKANEDILDENLSIDDKEKLLDDKAEKYKKYNEKHPMKGITFDKSKNKYQVKYEKINTYYKKLNEASNKIIENFNVKNKDFLLKKYVKKSFSYKNHYFIVYQKDDDLYFDIQHIISVLNLKKTYINDKYKEFSDEILFYVWHKNQFDGYFLRELINEKTMYKIILSSNSVFSKSFKDDVGNILIQLRKENELIITNEAIIKKPKKNQLNMNIVHCNQLKPQNYKIYSYDNDDDVLYAKSLVINGNKISLSKYIKKHVLYSFLMPIKDDENRIIIKFGYSEDILDRIESLRTEYKTQVFLIGIKIINGKRDEKLFHNVLKSKYPELIYPYKIGTKEKTELYGLNEILINEFDQYLNDYNNEEDDEDGPVEITNGEKQIISAVKKQEYIFTTLMNEFRSNSKTNLVLDFLNDKELSDYLITKENNHFNLLMKDKKIQIQQNKLEILDKESEQLDKEFRNMKLKIQLLEKEIELTKIKKSESPNVPKKNKCPILKL